MDLKRVVAIATCQIGRRKSNGRYAVKDGTCGRERREATRGLGFSRVVSKYSHASERTVPDVSGRCVSHPPASRNRKNLLDGRGPGYIMYASDQRATRK